jgi:2'-5' RNA ligase
LTTERARRLFFALWPDDETRARIVAATAAHVHAAGGRTIPRENLHVTVAFLGGVADSRMACVCDAASTAVGGGALDLVLDRVEHWKRQRILALESPESPAPLVALVARLWQSLERCGFAAESRPFRCHVTLAREARAPRDLPPGVGPILWRVGELSLMESVTAPEGARYERLRQWPLASDIPGGVPAFRAP